MSVLDPGFWSRDHEVEDLEADGVASLLGLLGLPARGRLLEYLARECELCAIGKARESALAVMLVRGLTPYTAASGLDLGQDFLAKLREVHRLYLRCVDALAGLTTFVLCPFCLSESVVSKGRVATYTNRGPVVRRRFRCLNCGRWTTRYPTWGPGWLSVPRAVRDYMLYLTNGGRYAKDRGSYSPRVVGYVEKAATLFRLAAGGDSARLLPEGGAVELDVAIPREGDVATSVGLYRSRQRLDPADPPELLSWSRTEVRLEPTAVVGRVPRYRGVLRLGEVPRGRAMLVVTFAVRRPLVVRL
ncbi:MAG: hypothetical protein LM564_04900 [Desulfurococcaceae archaeon]|nr:hypothetical protein [Desulfurococcaceae archaeon]